MTRQTEIERCSIELPNILAGKSPVTKLLLRELAEKHREYDLTKLDTSQVIDMSSMFSRVAAFNQPIGDWDVSNAADMHSMFRGAISFHQDISWWNINRDCGINDIYEECLIPEEFKALPGRYEKKVAAQAQDAMIDTISADSFVDAGIDDDFSLQL